MVLKTVFHTEIHVNPEPRCEAGCGFYTSKQKIPQKIPQRFRKDSATSLCQIQKIPQRFRKDSDDRFKRFRKDSAKIPMPDSKDSAKIPQRFRCQFRKNTKRFRKDSDARSKRFRKDSAKDSAKIPQRFRKTSPKCSTSEKLELDIFAIEHEIAIRHNLLSRRELSQKYIDL